MDIKFFVRTTKDREFNYDIPYIELVDKKRKPVKSFIEQLLYISQYDSVLLEDDLFLCEDFEEKIKIVINFHPNKIINFFTKPNLYFTTHEAEDFSYNQCTYYPKGIAFDIAVEMINLLSVMPNAQYDVLECAALRNLGITHIQYRPCLVQHLDNSSLVGNNSIGKRITPYFEDYLNKLNIAYKDAFKIENREKLNNIIGGKK